MDAKLKKILSDVAEANELLQRNEIEDAVLLSGEALACAYEQWAQHINNHLDSLQQVDVMAIAASCHCGSLAAMGNFHDAYATAIGAILQISIDPNHSDNIDQSLLSIYTTAVFSLLNTLSASAPESDDARIHITHISRYLASMLYHYYNTVGKAHSDSPYLNSAYEALPIMRQYTIIETPTITVLDEQVNPSSPHSLIGDLVGRSRALGLLTD